MTIEPTFGTATWPTNVTAVSPYIVTTGVCNSASTVLQGSYQYQQAAVVPAVAWTPAPPSAPTVSKVVPSDEGPFDWLRRRVAEMLWTPRE